MGAGVSSVMIQLDNMDRGKRCKIFCILNIIIVASIIVGTIGPAHLHSLRYLGFALIFPAFLIIKSLLKKTNNNVSNNNATQATAIQEPTQPLPKTEGVFVIPAPPIGARSGRSSNIPYPPQQYAMYPQSGASNSDFTRGQILYPSYSHVDDPPPAYPEDPPRQDIYPLNNQEGSLVGARQNYPLPPPPSYDEAVKAVQQTT